MSFGADLKAALDPLFNNRVYLDTAPPNVPFPYAVVYADILRVPLTSGDGVTRSRRRRAQVTVWQLLADESDDLAAETETACELGAADAPRTRATVIFSRRLPINAETPDISQRVLWVQAAERMPRS